MWRIACRLNPMLPNQLWFQKHLLSSQEKTCKSSNWISSCSVVFGFPLNEIYSHFSPFTPLLPVKCLVSLIIWLHVYIPRAVDKTFLTFERKSDFKSVFSMLKNHYVASSSSHHRNFIYFHNIPLHLPMLSTLSTVIIHGSPLYLQFTTKETISAKRSIYVPKSIAKNTV